VAYKHENKGLVRLVLASELQENKKNRVLRLCIPYLHRTIAFVKLFSSKLFSDYESDDRES
jgi:hypothetical protein